MEFHQDSQLAPRRPCAFTERSSYAFRMLFDKHRH
jgi:hypothetical protein